MDDAGQKLIAGRHCPKCGYDLTGREIAAEVRCPECGRVSEYEKLSIGPPPSVPRRALDLVNEIGGSKILGVLVVVFLLCFLLAILWPVTVHMGATPEGMRCLRLRSLSWAVESYCQEWEGQQPPHVGVLVASGHLQPRDFCDDDVVPSLQNRTFGCINLESFDSSRPEDVAALLAAANAVDISQPSFRFADIWLTRLPPPSVICESALYADLIQAWALPNDDRSCAILFADGRVHTVSEADWANTWAADARGRQSLGLTPIEPPPVRIGE